MKLQSVFIYQHYQQNKKVINKTNILSRKNYSILGHIQSYLRYLFARYPLRASNFKAFLPKKSNLINKIQNIMVYCR